MTKKKEEWLKFFVALYVLAVIVSIFVGVILLAEGSAVGYYLIFIPVGLVLINIILNVIFKIKRKKNKK